MRTGTVVPVEFDPTRRNKGKSNERRRLLKRKRRSGPRFSSAVLPRIWLTTIPSRFRCAGTSTTELSSEQSDVSFCATRHSAPRSLGTAPRSAFLLGARPVWTVKTLSATSAGERPGLVLAARRREVTTEFDLDRGPLIRFRLLTLADDCHELLFTAHHIICDEWSLGVVLADIAALYREEVTGTVVGIPVPVRFGDYAIRERSEAGSPEAIANEAFWLGRYHGEPPCWICRPIVRGPSSVRSTLRGRTSRSVETWGAELREFGEKTGASLAGVLLAGFEAFVFRDLRGACVPPVGVPARRAGRCRRSLSRRSLRAHLAGPSRRRSRPIVFRTHESREDRALGSVPSIESSERSRRSYCPSRGTRRGSRSRPCCSISAAPRFESSSRDSRSGMRLESAGIREFRRDFP